MAPQAARRPEVSQQMSCLVAGSSQVLSQYVFFPQELLTSHLMIIIFMKQPKQRSLSWKNKTRHFLMMFPFSTSLDKKNTIPKCCRFPQTGETHTANPTSDSFS